MAAPSVDAKILGCLSFDEMLIKRTTFGDTPHTTWNYAIARRSAHAGIDADAGHGNPNSRGALNIPSDTNDQTSAPDAFDAITQDWISYEHRIKIEIVGFGAATTHAGLTANHLADGAPHGAARIKWEIEEDSSPSRARAIVQVHTSVDWVDSGLWGAYINTPTPYMLMTLQIDLSTGTPRHRLVKDGVQYTFWQANTNLNNAGNIKGTCSLSGTAIGGKGDTDIDMFISDLWVFDDDAESVGYGTGYAVFARYPIADLAPDDGVAVGNAADCSGDKWRAVDDVEDLDDQGNDYITIASGDEQGLEIDDFSSGTIIAVAVSYSKIGVGNPNQDMKLQIKGEAAVIKSAIPGLNSGFGGNFYFFMEKTPEATPVAWDRDEFNDLQVVLTNDITPVYLVCAHILGTGLARPTKAAACPAAADRLTQGLQITRPAPIHQLAI